MYSNSNTQSVRYLHVFFIGNYITLNQNILLWDQISIQQLKLN